MTNVREITDVLLKAAAEFNQELELKIAVEQGSDAALFGDTGVLDSLNLVSFIILVEQEIADHFDTAVTLADEKALSQRRSPFRTIGTLAEHVADRLSESGA